MIDRTAVFAEVLQHLLVGFDHRSWQHFFDGNALERRRAHDLAHQAAALDHLVDVLLGTQVVGVDQRRVPRVLRSDLDVPATGRPARVEAQQEA
ncbi:hypothetical protein D3C71_1954010 [compost metagenome]